MRQALQYLYEFSGSYGLAIILMTVALRVVLLPLTAAGMRSTFKMQEVNAQVNELKKKYKKDTEQLNRATMDLWKKHGVNPFAGCLTMLAQLPIMFGFVAALNNFDFGVYAAFLWIPHLGKPDPFYILPVLAAVGTFFQSRLTTPATDASMQAMTYLFPVMILFFGLRMAAGFTLFWVFSSLFAVVERFLIVRPLRPPAAAPKA